MKRGLIQKNTLVNDDEKYLEGINLITGDKIDYSRHILSPTQINNLCVNENISKIDKFLSVITNGEKIQKWSLFENLPLYIESSQAAQKILSLIQKNYVQYEQFINIMGEGFSKFLKKCQTNLNLINKKCYESIFRIMLRTLTNAKIHGSDILSDWMMALNLFFHLSEENEVVNERKAKLSEFKEFINGSFSMTTLPQRRKTALEMINALIEQSQQILSQAHSKILFFNNDLNPLTRLVICNIVQKILKRDNVAQIWKCVTDYYYKDKSVVIKDKAFCIMSKLYYCPNAEHIFSQFDSHQMSYKEILIKYSPLMLKTFGEEIKVEPMYQLKIFSFLNRLIRENMDLHFQRIIECYKQLLEIIPETVLINELELKRFNLQNMKVICDLVELYSCSCHIEFKDEIKKQLLKGLRYHQFYINANALTIQKLIDILDLSDIQEVSFFMLILAKQIDFSKWKNVLVLMSKVPKIKFFQSHLQKMIGNVVKIYSNCPYFMLDKIHQVILQLILVDRKLMDVYIKIRQKCLGSKNWMLRRNFIKMYTYFKMNGSFQFNKLITPLVYKNIVNEKNVLIKMEFVKQFNNAYSFLDPNFPQEKISIKEVITRFAQDKDRELSSLSAITLEKMKIIDRDFQSISDKLVRNKDLLSKELLVEQVQPEQKKNVKTEKVITKEQKQGKDRPQKLSMIQTRTIANLPRLSNIEKNKLLIPQKASLTRSTSTQAKKDIKKLFVPTGAKKSRF